MIRWWTSGSALPSRIFSRFSSVLGWACTVAESSSYSRPVLAETVNVRSGAVPPVGASKVTGSGDGAAGLLAVHVPAVALQVQPGGLPVRGHSSSAPYFSPITTGFAFAAGVLIVITNRIPVAAPAVSRLAGLPPPPGMLIVTSASSSTGVVGVGTVGVGVGVVGTGVVAVGVGVWLGC